MRIRARTIWKYGFCKSWGIECRKAASAAWCQKFHGDEEEGNLRRYDEKEGEFTEINTSAVVADYNKGGFNNVDCNDSIVYSATKYKRKTSHLWRTAMEVPIFKLLPGAAWLLWRTIHPAKTTTYREFLSAIVSTTIDAPFLTYVRKRKDTNLRGRLRFTEQPISQLRPQQIRAEFGPHRKYDISIPVRGKKRRERAHNCMFYLPEEAGTRVICDKANCNRQTRFRCEGCGARACMKINRDERFSHMRFLHSRYDRAIKRLRRAL